MYANDGVPPTEGPRAHDRTNPDLLVTPLTNPEEGLRAQRADRVELLQQGAATVTSRR